MNKFNRKIEYALMALQLMSEKRQGQLTSVSEICEVTGSPFDGTARVMQIMANHGILKSDQGVQGGYQIVRDLSKLSLFDLGEMILGPLGVVKCMRADESKCELLSSCNIRSPINEINSKLIQFYRQLRLNDVLKRAHRPPPLQDRSQFA